MDNKENLNNFEVLVHGVQNLNINVNSESSPEELGTQLDINDVEALRQEILSMDNNNIESLTNLQYSSVQRLNALHSLRNNKELDCIYYLVDSHAQNLRLKSIYRYDLVSKNSSSKELLKFKKRILAFKHPFTNVKENTQKLLDYVEDMPKEWNVIQITSQFNNLENCTLNVKNIPIVPMHMTVFNCGKDQFNPFTMVIEPPTDKITNNKIEIMQAMLSFITQMNETLLWKRTRFANFREKSEYMKNREKLDVSLSSIIKDVQNLWFREWRCLFIGKYENEKLESELKNEIHSFITNSFTITCDISNIECLLCYIVKGSQFLTSLEVKRALQHCFRNVSSFCLNTAYDFVITLQNKLKLSTAKRHPVILIVEEMWDCIPYEMMDVFSNNPCTRLPSLLILYMLYKEYEGEIENGYKIIKDYKSGVYVVNPDRNLDVMEARMMNFINYWLPDWTGTSGYRPSSDEFYEYLKSSSIFTYAGHGNGAHLMDVQKLQHGFLKSVVCLFGCSSVVVKRDGVHVEFSGPYYSYLIANCPCVVGNLWSVTDIDTDTLSTNFFSNWLPSKADIHWKYVDKTVWKTGKELKFSSAKNRENISHNPILVQALAKAKSSTSFLMTRAACVVRGLPVKLEF